MSRVLAVQSRWAAGRRHVRAADASFAAAAACGRRHASSSSAAPGRLIGTVPEAQLRQRYDVVIVGGGPTGVAAGMRAAGLGRRALIVDQPKLPPREDGLDVSFGAPTGLFSKAMRDTGKHLDVRSLRSMGLGDDVIWQQVRNMCIHLATMNAEYQIQMLDQFKVDYVQARARCVSGREVAVTLPSGETVGVETENVLLASGSRPRRPDSIPFDDRRIFDSDTLNLCPYLPRSVVVVGSGIIGVEYAKIFQSLNAKVSMNSLGQVEKDLTAHKLDRDVTRELLGVLRSADVQIYEETQVKEYVAPASRSLSKRDPVLLRLASTSGKPSAPESLECDLVLAAVGRLPNTHGLGLESAGVELDDRGHIKVGSHFETSAPNVYAAGDVIGPPGLASTGTYQAQGAITAMFNAGDVKSISSYPVGIWTVPEVGYYGLTKEDAAKQGYEAAEGVAAFRDCLRGRVFAPEGHLKLVFDAVHGTILGVHIIGEDACELVHYGMELVRQGSTIFDLIDQVYTAVTFGELFREAAKDGNSKVEFGFEWRQLLKELGVLVGQDTFTPDAVKAAFDTFDTDGDKALDKQELIEAFRRLHCEVNDRMAATVIRLIDTDGSGTIQLDEFLKLFQVLKALESRGKKAPVA